MRLLEPDIFATILITILILLQQESMTVLILWEHMKLIPKPMMGCWHQHYKQITR